ncbi:excalibur calcium-binding domain-containing protein [Arthrobacter oryzae]|uniref:excalibur calcium-binding domain-containing protein n=1 Tax=Arthrobacter oryzae TaxID=409290 RepID=UPI00277F09AE|nr:excalibur calcium-binding domain-containing protein [Arthrobacter oryzae]MDQ0076847.1 beta-lactam-binding protein with PASTA domain [Arthrobacter oryzae]
MKKTLALVVLTGLLLTGCGGKQEAAPTESASAVAAVTDTVAVPGVTGLTLDKATDQLKDLGLEVESVDTVDGKMIISKKNWQVTSQDRAEGAQAAKGSTVHLGVKSLDKVAAEKAAADKAAAEKAAAEQAAADKAAADKAAADKAAADAAAAKLAAEQAAAQQAVPQPPVQQAVPQAPVAPAASYANCTAARAAGAAPVYAGTPGYGKHLDRDGDGIGCDK